MIDKWVAYANEPDPLCAVIDPADTAGHKNRYINLIQHKILTETIHRFIEGKTVLDVGCGTGRFYHLIESLGAGRIVGLDSCEEMLERYPGPSVCAPANHIPFPKEHFDAILCVWTLQYLDEQELHKVVLEMDRVLKPEGRIYLIEQLSFMGYDGVYPRSLTDYYSEFHNYTSIGLQRFQPIMHGDDLLVGLVRRGVVPEFLFDVISRIHIEINRHDPTTPPRGYLDALMEFRKA